MRSVQRYEDKHGLYLCISKLTAAYKCHEVGIVQDAKQCALRGESVLLILKINRLHWVDAAFYVDCGSIKRTGARKKHMARCKDPKSRSYIPTHPLVRLASSDEPSKNLLPGNGHRYETVNRTIEAHCCAAPVNDRSSPNGQSDTHVPPVKSQHRVCARDPFEAQCVLL